MADSNMQLQWTDEQWNKVRQVVYEEARRARVAGNILPLYGPLEPNADYVQQQTIAPFTPPGGAPPSALYVQDRQTLQLSTLQVEVFLRGAQVADPELTSALIAFRRAASVLARLEDMIILTGQQGSNQGPPGPVYTAANRVAIAAGIRAGVLPPPPAPAVTAIRLGRAAGAIAGPSAAENAGIAAVPAAVGGGPAVNANQVLAIAAPPPATLNLTIPGYMVAPIAAAMVGATPIPAGANAAVAPVVAAFLAAVPFLPGAAPPPWQVTGGQPTEGLLFSAGLAGPVRPWANPAAGVAAGAGVPRSPGEALVNAISGAIGRLEGAYHLGPFACVLDQEYFNAVQTPDASLVLPQDRILPFLGGGALVRSSALPPFTGMVIALGGEPVDLVVATDISVQFLQVTTDPYFVFRVYEKIVLRVKQPGAIAVLS